MINEKHLNDPNNDDQNESEKSEYESAGSSEQHLSDDIKTPDQSRVEPTLNADTSNSSEIKDTNSTDDTTSLNQKNIDQVDDQMEEEERERELDIIREQQDFRSKARKRFLGAENIRPFLYIGTAVVVLISGIGYFIVDKVKTPPEIIKADSKTNVPQTRVKPNGVMNAEQAAYTKQMQDAEAQNADKNGGTYISSFINEQTETDTFNEQPIVQPGMVANQARQQYFDKNGNSYTSDQAMQLVAQNQQIEGVTYGQGSIQDQQNSIHNGQSQITSTPSNVQTPAVTPYAVTTYNASSRNSENSTQSAIDSDQSNKLDKASSETAEWQKQYLALRQKKAQLIDQKAQKAFENQVTGIIESIKPTKTNDQAGAYQVKAYKSSSESYNNSTALSQKNYSQTNASINGSSQATATTKPIASTGDIFKAIIKTKVNTDEGTDVLATVVSGSLKGATLIGTVKPSNDNVQIAFTKLLRKGKSELAINAVARSLDGNSLGMADSVKRHHLQKYSSLVTASLLSGVGKAYQQTAGSNAEITNGTVVTTSSEPSSDRILGNAAGELGNQLSSDIRSLAKRPTTYIVNQGKVFNLFFNAELVEADTSNKRISTK